MNAIDTNILARYFLNDDDVQSPLAFEYIKSGAFVSNSVILETAWLLQSRYSQSPQAVSAALLALIGMPDIVIVDSVLLVWALQQYAKGADIADMFHLIEASGHESFLTFDRKLAKQAGINAPIQIKIAGE